MALEMLVSLFYPPEAVHMVGWVLKMLAGRRLDRMNLLFPDRVVGMMVAAALRADWPVAVAKGELALVVTERLLDCPSCLLVSSQ